nr:glycosyltransferase family 39 protein [Actinomycetota bacterium]
MTDRTARRVLLGLVVLAAALRLWRIGHQSFWLDEVFTAGLVNEDLWGLLKGVRETESTPHLYYLLAWLWEKVAGDGEGALRSLSALFGIATVPVVYAAARERFSAQAALLAAALAAVNPWFVWHSQEARSYALLVLLAAVSLLFFLRALRDPSRRSLTLWAVFSALAVLTHYFAAFTVGAEALWLLWAHRTRPVWAATGALVAVGVALAPLALSQRATGHTAFIEGISLGRRITDLPKRFVTGELGTPTPGIGPLAGLLVAAGAALLVWRATRAE